MGVEDGLTTLDKISTPPVLMEGGLTEGQRKTFMTNAIDFLQTQDKVTTREFVMTCANSSPEAKSDFELMGNFFYNDIKTLIASSKSERKGDISQTAPEQLITKATPQPLESKQSNKLSEEERKKMILGKLEISDFTYIDLKVDKKTGKYEVAEVEQMNRYVYGRAETLFRTLNNPISAEKIERAFKLPSEQMVLNENELLALNCIRENIDANSRLAFNTTGNTVTSDVEAKFTLSSPKAIITSMRDELAQILDAAINLPGDVAEGTMWLAKNAGHGLEKVFKSFFHDSKAINQKSLDEFSKKGLVVVNQEQDPSTGFSATLLRDENTKELTLGIRGTDDFTDWLYSNSRLMDSRAKNIFDITKGMPKQMVSLVNYIENNPDIKKVRESGGQINVVGHSLGGALSQILTAMYPGLIKQTHTFNAPGIKQITPELNPNDRKVLSKAKRGDFIKTIEGKLLGYSGNIETMDFSNVLNVRNEDWIGSIGDTKERSGHIGISTEKLPGQLHFVDGLRTGIEGLSYADFNRVFGIWSFDEIKDNTNINK